MIHLVWFGPGIEEACKTRDAWQQIHPDLLVKLWTTPTEEAFNIFEATREFVIDSDHARHLSNLTRYSLLYELGGYYVDCDTIPLAPITILGSGPWSASVRGRPEGAFLASPSNSQWIKSVIDRCRDFRSSTQTTAPNVSGSKALLDVYLRNRDIRLIPAGVLFSADRLGRPVRSVSMQIADHKWQTSSAR